MLIFDQLKKNDPHLRLLTFVVLGGLAILLAGLWWVQIVSAKEYRANLETQSFRTVRVPAVRGKIFDRNGIALADNRPSYNVNLYLEELRDEFKKTYDLSRPRKVVTNSHAFWKHWFGASNVTTQNVRLSREQTSALAWQSRQQVADGVVQQISRRLQQPLSLDSTNFRRHYEKSLAMPLPVLANLDTAQIARFEEQMSTATALDLEVQPIRFYPYNTAAAHLLGHLQKDDSSVEGEEAFFNYRLPDYRGQVGIEAGFDSQLRGKAGAKSVLVNNLGYRQTENIWSAVEPGQNVTLTIDLPIQQAAERAMARLGASTRGAVVVMDTQNGDVLAMVSSPTFNPNDFAKRISTDEWQRFTDPKLRPLINRATQENYAPGSIFKPVVALAALESGLNPAQTFNVAADPKRPGKACIYVGNRKIEDTAPPGEYNFRRAFKLSSNSYFITNGIHAGIQNIIKLGQRLHLGEGLQLPTRQETRGIFPNLKRVGANWFDGDTANICIGQGEVAVTPLQMAVMTTAIANGGKVFKPRLVQKIEPQDLMSNRKTEIFPRAEVRNELGVKPQNLQILREAMLADVEDSDGTGRPVAIQGFRIAGKTGTAQVMNLRNQIIDHTTWFISFAPYENPRYAVVVMVESGGSGGATCAPIAREIYLTIQQREKAGSVKTETLAQTN